MSTFEEGVFVGVEEGAFAGRQQEAIGGLDAIVEQAKEGDDAAPGAVAIVDGVAVALEVVLELGVQAREGIGAGVEVGLHGQEAALFGVQDEHEAHEDGDEPGVHFLRVVAAQVVENGAIGEAIGAFEAREQFAQGGEDLFAEFCGDGVLVFAAGGEQRGEAFFVFEGDEAPL
ncbi:MAG TPA: hypothetical protein PK156_48615, partial [Polyangium sp.]|nr:hypothetical protein [Polyangium sp.]